MRNIAILAVALTVTDTTDDRVRDYLTLVHRFDAQLHSQWRMGTDAAADAIAELDLIFERDGHLLGLPIPFTQMTPEQACEAAASFVATGKRRETIQAHCMRRSWYGTKHDNYRSLVDETKVHDGDRFAALGFYYWAIQQEWIDPVKCKYHRIDRTIDHPESMEIAIKKLSKRPRFGKKHIQRWKMIPHDVERFGTRGMIDLPAARFMRYIGDCFDSIRMDENYPNALAYAFRADELCNKLKVCTVDSLTEAWQ